LRIAIKATRPTSAVISVRMRRATDSVTPATDARPNTLKMTA
jgi:hypothetical protein